MNELARLIANLPPEKRAEMLRRLQQRGRSKEAGPPAPAPSLPLSFAQQRLWLHYQLEPGSVAYNLTVAFRILGALDGQALERSLHAVVERHESLRTTFRMEKDSPVQVVSPEASVRLERIDLGAESAGRRDERIHEHVRTEAQRPFELGTGPLLRASLFRLGEQEHVLVLCMHHIVTDGWSFGVLLRELLACYDALVAGKAPELPPLPIQYPQFAQWQRERLQGSLLEEQLGYWRERLAGAPAALELPTSHPRPPGLSGRGDQYSFTLPRALAEAVKAFAAREGATSIMVLKAAWHVLLSRYSGQEDLCVGLPSAGRDHADLERLIGFFVNTLVVRTRPAGNLPFRHFLRQVREAMLGALAHQELPLQKLLEELRPPREPGRTPLFQVSFSAAVPVPSLAGASLELHRFPLRAEASTFELGLTMAEHTDGLTGRFDYSTDLFEPAAIVRMAGHLSTLLEAAVASPDTPLAHLPLLSEAERHQLLVEWNDTHSDYPREACVHTLFEAQVERTPDAVAVDFGEQTLSYRKLNQRANQLAHRLMKLGVGPGARVGLCVERSADMVVGMLGILKAGGAYVPLDVTYPRERLAFMVEDSSLAVLLTQETLRGSLPASDARVLCLDASGEGLEAEPDSNPHNAVQASEPIYVIYTSGSTGRPKGVPVPHRGVVRLVLHTNYIHFTPEDRVAQASNASFDAATFEVWGALLHGARLVGVSRDVMLSPEDFRAYLRQRQISVLFVTAALFNQFAMQLADTFQSVRHLLVGGDALSPNAARTVLAGGPPGRLLNGYGPTESTTFATWHEVRHVPAGAVSVPIGRPLANTQLYVLDSHLQPVPVGVPGELYIGGDGLALGYLNRPELTAERFVAHPFSTLAGARLYRTGDKVRYLADGSIDFLGRLDTQVKVRGFRIELGEVESALEQCPGVRQCVVMAREDGPGGKRLVAYVVGTPGESLEAGALREQLKARLPEYMVPSAFVVLEVLPLTPNGKVDRKALPAPEASKLEGAARDMAPRTPTEEVLAGVWAQVLGVKKVGLHDNFFELGGDSILAIQVIARANQAGLRLTATQLFQHPTVAELAQVATAAGRIQAEQGVVQGPVPLTPIQRWFLARELPDAHHFNQAVMLEARQPVDAGLLEKALRRVVEHHDALRLRFTRGPSGWEQVNAGLEQPVSPRRMEVSALPEEEQQQAILQAAAQLQASLKLEEGLLLRALLVERGQGRTARLLLVVHHLAVDGVSWRVLLEDLNTAYLQLRRGEAVVLPPKTSSFRTWAKRLSTHAQGPEVAAELPFWLEGAADVAPLPVDKAEGPNTVASARVVDVSLEVEETRALLQEVPTAYRAHINDALLSALARVLARWTGQHRVRVDLEGHGREELFADVDISRTVGWFTAVHPVLLEVPEGGSAGDGLRAVRDVLRRLPNRGLGYGLLRYLREDGAPERLRELPAAQVVFNYLGQFDAMTSAEAPFAPAREPAGPVLGERGVRSHVLEVNGLVIDGRLRLSWTYSENLHERATVEALARSYLEALRELLRGRSMEDARKYTLADFPLARLDDAGLARVVEHAPELEDVYPLSPMQQGMLFHALMEPSSGVYSEQLAWSFHGAIDARMLQRAWEELLARHPVLRTSFLWEGLAEPLQVVHARTELPWRELDWRELPPEERRTRLERFLEEDRLRGFEPSRAPLLRLFLIRLEENVYRFIWGSHHLLLDGWSLPLLLQELLALYEGLERGQPARLERRVPYREYIAWLQRQDAARMEAFWRSTLAGFTTPTPLPGSERTTQPQEHAERLVRVSAASTAALESFAKRHQLTLNTLAQAAWALVLSRHAGEQDVVFGATTSGRPAELPGVEGMIGLFINTLPVRVKLPAGERVGTWLEGLQARQMELRQYEHSPLVRVQGWSQVPRGTPLFESLLVFENYPMDASLGQRASRLEVRDIHVRERANYPLTASAVPGRELTLKLAYDTPRFDAAGIERLLAHWRTALEGLVVDAGQRLGEVPLLTAEERQQVLVAWNDTHSDYPREACVHEVFEARVERTPDAVAVELGERKLSYRELDEKANQLAHLLRARGVGPDSRVALCLERSVELVVALVGILKAGGAYVPLDVAYPRERLACMLEDARPRVLVTTRELAGKLPTEALAVVYLEEEAEALAAQPKHAPRSGTHPRNLAYVDFTSGSTGRPKGVGTEHGSVLRTVLGARYAQLGPDENFLLIAPISFDASTLEVWGCLLNGGRLVVYPPQPPGDVKELEAVLRRHAVTVLHLTAGLFTQMVDANLEGLRGVRQLLTGGDVVSAPHVRKVLEELRIPVTACYGPTESTLFTTCHRMTDAGRVGPVVPIGTPIGNTQVYVLDGLLRPVPVGTAGELYIGGEGLARGYLEQPGLTAERFLPNPYGAPGTRMYRTGDLARWRPDGVLEFLGRGDNQVKVRGFRVEPGEVESALALCPGVRECVVVARGAGADGKRLVAYVVGAPGESLKVGVLREQLVARLPEYMVPSAFVLLEVLPLTPNGKVDRKSLPAPGASKVEVAAGYVAPRTPTEEVLASVFAQVLGVRQVGANDSFFELGGHSLLAAQAISRLRSTFGVELPVRALFESPTVAELAVRIDDALQRDSSSAQLPPLVPQPREGALPLSFAQQRLWFLDQLEPGSPLYNIPAALLLEGPLDVPALEATFQELLRRHESLRTVFPTRDGEPVQVILPPGQLPLSPVDLSALPEPEREQEARRLVREAARHSFLLASHLPLHLVLVKLTPTRHLLVLVLHHIVSDGWSMGVLVREVASLYAAFSSGSTPSLPPLPLQYPDFALWQRSWLRGEVLQSQLDYWKQQLSGAPLSLELPTDRPRPPVQSYRGAQHPLHLPAALSESLSSFSRQHGVTLFMTLLAGFQTLLHRYSGQSDIIVGSPIAGRTRSELEGLIGFFVNTLALRSHLGDSPSFRSLLARVRETTLGAYAHQDLPFEKLVEELHPARDLSRSPIFQVMFALQNAPDSSLSMSGLSLSPVELGSSGIAKFDLTLNLRESPEGLRGWLEYNTDLFDSETVARMAGHFHTLLASALAQPELPVSQLPLLSETERHQLLVEWNDTHSDYPREACVHTLFEAQVERTPDAVAVDFGAQTLSYRELNQRANQLAHRLLELGVGPGARIGLCVERSVDMVVGMLGILKAGGAYVPLDVTYPRERLAFMVQDSSVQVLLTQQSLAAALPESSARVLCLDAASEGLASEPDSNPPSAVQASEPIYVIYTSGSTGRPKGVPVPHRGVVRLVLHTNYIHFTPEDRVAQASNASFDAATFEVWGALLHGARLVGVSRDVMLSPEGFRAYLRQRQITVLFVTAALFNQFAMELADTFQSVRHLLVGGDALSPNSVRTVLAGGPPGRLLNGYGPTESTTFAAWHEVRHVPAGAVSVPIGRPLANTQLYVLDSHLQPVPVGVPGELYIGGDGLALGYLNRPELTAERFVAHPFSSQPGARLYRTGDLVRFLADGSIDFLGRLDSQVKVRGFRIELGEVESALAQCPGVRQCVVLAREDGPGGKRLVAYVVGTPELEVGVLREQLVARLPEYMVPSAFVLLEVLPLTPNGKVDRKSLPAPEASKVEVAAGYVAPRTPTEEVLAGVFAQVLGVRQVGVNNSFFELGGHSLLATQAISRLRSTFGVELPVRALFEAPTVSELAVRLESLQRDSSSAQLPPLVPQPREGALPLSFAQQRLWFLDQLQPGSPLYNIPAALLLEGPLDVPALESTFQELLRRHESLRTVFPTRDGEPVQVILPPGQLPLSPVDLSALPEPEREQEARRLVREAARHSFLLASHLPLHLVLVKLAPSRHLLVLVLHHIVSDGWSMSVLVREVAALYAAFSSGGAPSLPPLPLQYPDFALWQRSWLRGEVLQAQLDYWKQQLSGAPLSLELPTDRPRPPVQSYRGAQHPLHLPAALSESLSSFSRQHGVTLFMTLLAGFQTLLHRYSGQADIIVGSPIAGRTRSELEGLIGFFVNTLALRSHLGDSPSFRSLLARVRDTTLGAYAHQDLPFEKLVEELHPARDLSRSPIFQVMFALQNAPDSSLSLSGLSLSPLELESSGIAKFDLSLHLRETPEGLRGGLEYNTDLFDAQTVARMAGHFHTLLASALAQPELPVSQLPLLSEAERHQLLVEWNDTHSDFPRETCLHELFEAQAARTPEAPALIDGTHTLTYAELNQRANQLAHTLRALGVRAETPVGICTRRSWEMVVTLLGILKAGGTYVPLDPAYPPERLALILSDSQVRVLVTQAQLTGRLPAHSAHVLFLDTDADTLAQARTDNPARGAWPDSVAYLIYTSGSTGRPKGVAIQHTNAVAFLHWAQGVFEPRVLAGTLAATSIAFDLSVFELFLPLSRGGTVILASNILELPHLPAAARVTLVNTVPSAMSELLRSNSLPAGVRVVNLAGEPLPTSLVRQLHQLPGLERVHDLYGPSETTTYSTFTRRSAEGPATIGRPISGTRVYLLDAHLQPVPHGVTGELFIGGAGVARGYLGRPELTAERFIPDPFSTTPGARLYRTGDLARYLPEGGLEYLGRSDFQVKVRGFRIELGEIEAVLSQHPAVRQAVVLAREDKPGDKRLVAYLTVHTSVPTGELRSLLQQRLPEHMVPPAFVLLEALPLTPNGKLDRKALPAPDFHSNAATFVPPSTPTEQTLADLWQQLLGLERVGANDNFFALGGHSLLATRLASRLRSTFGVELPVRALFEASTVTELAARIEAALRDESSSAQVPPLVPQPREGALPLSFAQQRLWFLDQLEPGSPLYNLPTALLLEGALGVPALEATFQELLRRHEALRTVFPTRDGEPVQVILPPGPLPLSPVDLSALPEPEREQEVRRLVREAARHSFHLASHLPLRIVLLKLAPTRHLLMLVMHHIVSDGWSIGVLVREVASLYAAFSSGRAPSLPPLPLQYPDFALWQRSWLRDEVLARQLDYWKQQLSGAPLALELPTDRPRPPVQTFRGAQHSFSLPPSLSEALAAYSRQQGATLFMTLLAAFQTLLHRYSGQSDIIVGSPIAGRTRAELEGLIGFFVNTLALRSHLGDAPSFRTLLARVRETTLGAYAHQDLPFERLVEELHPARDLSRAPIFQVMFALQNAPTTALSMAGLSLTPLELESDVAKFDLTLNLRETPQGLHGVLEYNTDLFDAQTVARLAGHFHTLLAGALAQPELPVTRLPLLTEAERHQVLVEWNDTRTDFPREACVHTLFEAQVERTPDAVAVDFESVRLTYRELNQRANQLAHRLSRLGVGPGTRVGLYLERSVELVVGMLGIIKAGGAYVPLDPSYPRERLAFMMEDASVRVLLTQQALAGLPPGSVARVVCLDAASEGLESEPDGNPRGAVQASEPIYVIYTSGSTGRPKGVLVPHRGVVRLVMPAHFIPLTAEDRVAQATNASFDVSTFEVWGALLYGARLVGVPRDVMLSPEGFRAYLRQRELTVLLTTTALFNQFTQELPDTFQSLRHLVVGGDALSPKAVRTVLAGGPPKRLLNGYGPTESTTIATWYEVKEVPEGAASVPIGRPLSNTQLYVLDRHLQPVPVGVPGELYIGGDGLALGYLNRPELTAEKFVAHPFSTEPGEKLYRTGDLVRYLADGRLDFLGRLDSQVKVRGFRIEPGEVESALGQCPGVRQCVVMAREDGPGGKRLVAYVVGTPELEAGALREQLKARLPEHMVPSAFVLLESLPLTPNGKVDRKALPAPDAPGLGTREALLPPRNELEWQLVQLWEEVLDTRPIGVRHDFFELGGHSLLAARLAARVQRLLGLRLSVLTLFQHPTIEQLATVLRREQDSSGTPRTLVRLRAGEPHLRPLFLVHGGGGGLLGYAELVRQLEPARPIYGLNDPEQDGGEPLPASVEEMARHYVARLREVQPAGPYLLGGWSFGGLVALEMAQQLQAAGETVALLALVDTHAPVARPALDELSLLAAFGQNLGLSWRHLPLEPERLGQLSGRALLAQVLELARHAPGGAPALELDQAERLFNVFKRHHEALRHYVPRPYAGPTVLLAASTPLDSESPAGDLGWSTWLTGHLRVHQVPGNHYTLLRAPHVATLAERLSHALDTAEGQEAA